MRPVSVASPVVNAPTIVHTLSRSLISAPISRPANSLCALRPTIASRRPRVKCLPSTSTISGRTKRFSAPTPRTPSARSAPLLRRGLFTAVTTSAVTAPPPSAVRATPGAPATMAAVSSGGMLAPSEKLAPLRRTLTRSALPTAINELVKLPAIVNTDTSTATTAAMPTTTTTDGPTRCGMLRRLKLKTAVIWRNTCVSDSTARERVDDVQALGAPSRQPRADCSHRDRERHAADEHALLHGNRRNAHRVEHRGEQRRGRDEAHDCRRHAQQRGLGEYQQGHGQVAEAVRLQHRELRYALADRLHHRVAGDEQQREQHGADDRVHDEADVADALDLPTEEIPF